MDMTIVDNAVYVGGIRAATPDTLDSTYEVLREKEGMAWIGLYRPDREEIDSVAAEFGLHHLAVADAIKAHQRAKLERYDNILFVVLRPARYLDEVEKVEFGELHVFVGPDFVVTIRHAESPDLGKVRHRMEQTPKLLCLGPEGVLAILDQVVDEYEPVGLENDIDEIEDQLFTGQESVARRIYDLSSEVIGFQRATSWGCSRPCSAGRRNIVSTWNCSGICAMCTTTPSASVSGLDSFRAHLQTALTVHATLVGQQQNEEMHHLTEASLAQSEEVKKISAWAAILFAPTLVGTIYGMNFDHMPELHWAVGYPLALSLMLITSIALCTVFKRQRWL